MTFVAGVMGYRDGFAARTPNVLAGPVGSWRVLAEQAGSCVSWLAPGGGWRVLAGPGGFLAGLAGSWRVLAGGVRAGRGREGKISQAIQEWRLLV